MAMIEIGVHAIVFVSRNTPQSTDSEGPCHPVAIAANPM